MDKKQIEGLRELAIDAVAELSERVSTMSDYDQELYGMIIEQSEVSKSLLQKVAAMEDELEKLLVEIGQFVDSLEGVENDIAELYSVVSNIDENKT